MRTLPRFTDQAGACVDKLSVTDGSAGGENGVQLCSDMTSEAFTRPGAIAFSFMRGHTAASCPVVGFGLSPANPVGQNSYRRYREKTSRPVLTRIKS